MGGSRGKARPPFRLEDQAEKELTIPDIFNRHASINSAISTQAVPRPVDLLLYSLQKKNKMNKKKKKNKMKKKKK